MEPRANVTFRDSAKRQHAQNERRAGLHTRIAPFMGAPGIHSNGVLTRQTREGQQVDERGQRLYSGQNIGSGAMVRGRPAGRHVMQRSTEEIVSDLSLTVYQWGAVTTDDAVQIAARLQELAQALAITRSQNRSLRSLVDYAAKRRVLSAALAECIHEAVVECRAFVSSVGLHSPMWRP